MITFIAIAAPIAVLGAIDALAAKFGAESRPGFDERSPISLAPSSEAPGSHARIRAPLARPARAQAATRRR